MPSTLREVQSANLLGNFESKSRNSPFDGLEVAGRARYTIVRGRVVWRADGAKEKRNNGRATQIPLPQGEAR